MFGLFPRMPKKRFASPEAKEALHRRGLDSLDAIYRAAVDARHRHVGRSVWSTELADENGPFVAYFKLNWERPRVWPRMTDIVTGQALQNLAEREWRGIGALESLGFLVPERLALFEDGGVRRRAAVVVREVPPRLSLQNMLKDGTWAQLSDEDRRSLMLAVNQTLARISSAGLGWRSPSCRHFFPVKDARGNWRMWLIDCEGVHRAGTREILTRDCDKFIRSLTRARVDQDTLSLARECKELTLAAA